MNKISIAILTLLAMTCSLHAHRSILAKKHARRTLFAVQDGDTLPVASKDPESVEIKQMLGKTLVTDCGAYRQPILDLIEARYQKTGDPDHFKNAIDDFIRAVTVPLTDKQQDAIDAAQTKSTRDIIKLIENVSEERCDGKTGDELEECSEAHEDKLRDDVVNKIRQIEDGTCKPTLLDTKGEIEMVKCTKEEFSTVCDNQVNQVETKSAKACKYTSVETKERECEDADSKKSYEYLCDDVDAILDHQIAQLEDLHKEEQEAEKEIEDIENQDEKDTNEDIKERCEKLHAGNAAEIQKCITEGKEKAEEENKKAKEACEGKPKTYLDDYAYSRCIYTEKHKVCVEGCKDHQQKKLAFYYCNEVCEVTLEKRKLKIDKLKEMQENQEEFEKQLEEIKENSTCDVEEPEEPEETEEPVYWAFNLNKNSFDKNQYMTRLKTALNFGFEGLTNDEQKIVDEYGQEYDKVYEYSVNYIKNHKDFFNDKTKEKTSLDFDKLMAEYKKSTDIWDTKDFYDIFLNAYDIAKQKSKNKPFWTKTLTQDACQRFTDYQSRAAFFYASIYLYIRHYALHEDILTALRSFLNTDHTEADVEPYWRIYEKALYERVDLRLRYELFNRWKEYYHNLDRNSPDPNGGLTKNYTYHIGKYSYEHFLKANTPYDYQLKISSKCDEFTDEERKNKCNSIVEKVKEQLTPGMKSFRDRWSKFDPNFEITD